MTLVLTLESSPHPQATQQLRLDEGERVIGRAPDADWRIEDPDNFVSRRHCVVTGLGAGRFTVTDTSSGGVFLDNALRPLGSGGTADLRHGMRLRIGDVVLRVEVHADNRPAQAGAQARASTRPQAPAPVHPAPPDPRPRREGGQPGDPFDRDVFFAVEPNPAPPSSRPRDLPPLFEEQRGETWTPPAPEREGLPQFDDPLTLDPVLVPQRKTADRGFDWDLEPAASSPASSRVRERPPPEAGFDWEAAAAPPEPPPPRSVPVDAAAEGAGPGLEAFLRGLGLDAADLPDGDPEARLEALGREYRHMVSGLMQLLRMRAQEKGNARISQTVVGVAANNPMKFMPDVADALAIMLAPRSPGFTDAERAIAGAVEDLVRHQVSAWRGIQAALRRMVDRFDPKLVEAEVEQLGLLETLLAGGRKAKLWELYEKRFAEIARSAETRFLGEVGVDFRDAYESEDRKT